MGIVYECLRCGGKYTTEKIASSSTSFRCPNCGYSILKKIRPPIARRVKAT